MINAAIIGLGRWGQILVNSVQGKSDKIKIIAGRTETLSDNAKAFAGSHGFPLTASYNDLLQRSDIDAVILVTPHSTHAEQVQQAAAAGKHVFCEKPFTLNKATAEDSVKACRDAGIVLAVAHNRRFYPAYQELQELVRSGALGEILHIEGNHSGFGGLNRKKGAWRVDPSESPMGAMAGKGLHAIDAMIGLAGPIKQVNAISTHKVLDDCDDTTAMLLQFGAGTSGYLGTMDATAFMWRLAVFGTKGWAELRNHHRLVRRTIEDGNGESDKSGEDGETVKNYDVADTLLLEFDAFADAVTGVAPYPMTDEEMIATPALWEAAVRSAKLGQAVDV
ncbi:MAG: Gfo/Idh/MocA family oxidoreductase [Rhodospirillaceae bacterium]|jgi:predicted dehydrogenase|nr:Gfo/Idh/MocA family oxidoreductase [Rhodospirillales bacterium]MBT3905887.1 Gfo/Idh/MocA family oxidoreductase [Rhodospirillaceae bacterium]MBT4702801.1 Gfo/Idh/MocA family oxidoreductase [Rhodospirillaceae bacterium]MBT5036834.1 Gfo/Idh/MocA family oxidoreductase [Rhodospirillaceae bacterium]MBT6221098.1 Gfo/Idh/MocA family oxidoreductase [Rhodospirillaceae bacterium]